MVNAVRKTVETPLHPLRIALYLKDAEATAIRADAPAIAPERNAVTLKIKTDHANLLNALDSMACNPMYILRRNTLREAESLILRQEHRINELEKANEPKETAGTQGSPALDADPS